MECSRVSKEWSLCSFFFFLHKLFRNMKQFHSCSGPYKVMGWSALQSKLTCLSVPWWVSVHTGKVWPSLCCGHFCCVGELLCAMLRDKLKGMKDTSPTRSGISGSEEAYMSLISCVQTTSPAKHITTCTQLSIVSGVCLLFVLGR